MNDNNVVAFSSDENIVQVSAGLEIAVGITEEHGIKSVCLNPGVALREQYWTRVQQVAVSHCFSGLCLGLISDGTCMISERALRNAVSDSDFTIINNWVKEQTGVVQIAVNDGLFAVHGDGSVSAVLLPSRFSESGYGCSRIFNSAYKAVESWKNIKKIVTALQCGAAGLTYDGEILLAGANLAGEHCASHFSEVTDRIRASDFCFSGSEAEEMYYISADDGRIYLANRMEPVSPEGIRFKEIKASFDYNIYALDDDNNLYHHSRLIDGFTLIGTGCKSFAVGLTENYRHFLVTV